ncbi:MAG TPA: AMIN domain-containing protein [Terriglobales bacterium]|nr:AMIN domain-containing protein [Terriglobales bacterium]
MPRFSYVGALLAVASLWPTPISAQKSAPNGTENSARVQHVIVRGSGAAMEVEIQTSGAQVAPDTQAITGPDRIVVDFPGALPAAELRALKVNRGALKGIRSGLFFANPPITRIVLDLVEPQSYRISTIQNAIVVKLGPVTAARAGSPDGSAASAAKLRNASLAAGTNVAVPRVSTAVSKATALRLPAAVSVAPPPKPLVTVTFENGMLRIRAEKATLAQVLFEVQRQTQAEIAVPAGAEQEEVFADLGPAPARDVLAALLNGSPYNFIFVGNELALERVLLTRRDPSIF